MATPVTRLAIRRPACTAAPSSGRSQLLVCLFVRLFTGPVPATVMTLSQAGRLALASSCARSDLPECLRSPPVGWCDVTPPLASAPFCALADAAPGVSLLRYVWAVEKM